MVQILSPIPPPVNKVADDSRIDRFQRFHKCGLFEAVIDEPVVKDRPSETGIGERNSVGGRTENITKHYIGRGEHCQGRSKRGRLQ